MNKYDKEINDALDKMIENGADFKELVIVTSREEFKAILPMHQFAFRSVYGETRVNYDPLLPPNSLYIINQSEDTP